MIPAQHRLDLFGVFVTSPALSVLDVIPELGGRVIDEALRRRVVSLADLHEALADTPGRRGNTLRARLLHDSRDEPWSEAERGLHRVLRTLRLPERFESNYLVVGRGQRHYLDAALPVLRLAFEVDGFEFHGDRVAFERDRRRDVALARLGWRVVRFSAAHVLNEPAEVRTAIAEIVHRARRQTS